MKCCGRSFVLTLGYHSKGDPSTGSKHSWPNRENIILLMLFGLFWVMLIGLSPTTAFFCLFYQSSTNLDSGKSTLIGRILKETGARSEEEYRIRCCYARDIYRDSLSLALLVETFKEERERGISTCKTFCVSFLANCSIYSNA